MKRLVLIALALSMAGCATVQTEKVTLRNAAGMTATCGPYFNANLAASGAAQREGQCISDYQRQGYNRVPN